MSGTYHIGGGNNDFPDLVTAVDTLRTQGLNSPVTFNIYSGTYAGQVNLPGLIPGLGAANPLIIQNAPGESPVITSAAGHGFYLTGADYVTIQGLEITNCNGSGIHNYRSSFNSSDHNNYIDNYIHDVASGGNYSGIYVGYSSYCQVLQNEIAGAAYGIMVYYGNDNLVANNMVCSTSLHGIRVCYGGGNEVHFNSVLTDNDAAMYVNATYDLYAFDNIFFQADSGNGYAFYYNGSTSTYNPLSDYNDIYSPNALAFFNNGSDQTLSEWQTATGLDLHSISEDPRFVSTTDLHIGSDSPVDSTGIPITDILTDFDGDLRDSLFPDIGADEFGELEPYYCVNLDPEILAENVNPGDSIDYMITIHNCGDQNDTYDLTLTVTGQPWTHVIRDHTGAAIIDSISLLAASTDSFIVRVTVPGGATGGFTSMSEIIAASRYGARNILSDTSRTTTSSNAPLIGSYDVGGGNNNFPDLVTAAELLRSLGMEGPVTFYVYTGTYEGEVYLPGNVSGLSESNPLILQNAPGEQPVVTSDSGCGFFLYGADYITIQGFEIADCYQCGIFNEIADTDSATHNNFIGNYVHHTSIGGMYPAIRLNYGGQVQIRDNEIGPSFVGICNFRGKDVTIVNNMIYGTAYWNARSCYGLNNIICYNSFYGQNNSAFYWTYGVNATIKNNIFYQGASDSSYAFTILGDLSAYSLYSDYNDLYAPNAFVGLYDGTVLNTLTDFQTATGTDSNSICADPCFVDIITPNLHIDTLQLSPTDCAGIPISGITTDFDGDPRDPVTPDIGADEFTCAVIPSAITDLIISLSDDTTGMHHVTLQWSPSLGAAQYRIYKSITAPTSVFTLIGSTPDTTYTDSTAVDNAIKSFYYITANSEPIY